MMRRPIKVDHQIPPLLERAQDLWGPDAQLDMVTEEAAEVILAINHLRRGKADSEAVVGELADLQVMLMQAAMMFGEELFQQTLAEKVEQLGERVGMRV